VAAFVGLGSFCGPGNRAAGRGNVLIRTDKMNRFSQVLFAIDGASHDTGKLRLWRDQV
jgi:hypothetical protein